MVICVCEWLISYLVMRSHKQNILFFKIKLIHLFKLTSNITLY